MKFYTEIYTPLIKKLQDLNLEIRLKLSSMPLYTEREMKSLEQWLEEANKMVNDLNNASLLISHHLEILKIELQEQRPRDISRD